MNTKTAVVKHHWVHLAVYLLLGYLSSLCMAEDPRVALMPSGDQKASAIVELMEAALAQRDEVVLLDRANVDKLLMEQGISLDGLLSTESVLAVGTLLKCGVFAELHYEKADNDIPATCSLVAFDSVTGVRLCDETLGGDDDSAHIAGAAVKALITALAKQSSDANQKLIHTVSLLSVRDVDLPVMQSGIAGMLPSMLERILLKAPEVMVVERKRLEQVNKESELTGDLRDRLLASTVFVDIDLQRSSTTNSIRVRGALSNIVGKEVATFEFEVDSSSISKLVTATAQRILKSLELPGIEMSARSNRAESDRFDAEARHLMKRQRLDEALAAAEASLALAPDNVGKQAFLCEMLDTLGAQLARENHVSDVLNIVERTLAFRLAWVDADFRPSSGYPYSSFIEPLLRFLLNHRDELSPDELNRLANLRLQYRSWSGNVYNNKWFVQTKCANIDLWTNNRDEWLNELLAVGEEWPDMWPSALTWTETDTFRRGIKDVRYVEESLIYRKLVGLDEISPPGVKKLMGYYELWKRKGSLQAGLCELMLLRFRPDAFSGDIDARVKQSLNELVSATVEKKHSGAICYVVQYIRELRLNQELRVPELKRLMQECEHRKIVSLHLVEDLDAYDNVPVPGYYLLHAYEKLESGGYKIAPSGYNDVGSCGGILAAYHEDALAWLSKSYRKKYGKELDIGRSLNQDKSMAWRSTTTLYTSKPFDGTKWEFPRITSAALVGDAVYLVECAKRIDHPAKDPKYGYAIQRVDLQNGGITQLARVDDEGLFDDSIHVGGKAVYLPGKDGLMIVPFDGRKVWVMRRGSDLVDADVNAVVEVEDGFYMACSKQLIVGHKRSYSVKAGEGYLLRSDLDGINISVVASSARGEKKSPLDDCDPYQITGFYKDTPRNRFLFSIGGNWDTAGLYALDLESLRITRLWRESIQDLRAWGNDSLLVQVNVGQTLALWSCSTDKSERFHGNTFYGKEPAVYGGVECVELLNDRLYGFVGSPRGRRKGGFISALQGQSLTVADLVYDMPFPILMRSWQGKLVLCHLQALQIYEP